MSFFLNRLPKTERLLVLIKHSFKPISFHLAKVFKLFHIHHYSSYLPHLSLVKNREAMRQMLTLQTEKKEVEGVRKVICGKKKGRKEHKSGLHGM